MKRALDVVLAALLLILLLPLLGAIALAIKLESRGPVLFVQRRRGLHAVPISVWKFRTMVADAERRRDELLATSEDPHWLKLSRDPRVTRVGRFLRLTSLDEIPQLVMCLRGEMSLVGPRPLSESEYRYVPDWARVREEVLPGLTGAWQVRGRTRLSFTEMLELDCAYVRDWSLGLDLSLLARTVPAVLFRRGAN